MQKKILSTNGKGRALLVSLRQYRNQISKRATS